MDIKRPGTRESFAGSADWFTGRVNVEMFVGILSRMIPSQALISAVPEASQRGSFSAVSASLQQLSGGLGPVLAAAIIAQNADGTLRHSAGSATSW